MGAKKSKQERRAQRKQKQQQQDAPRRTPRLSRVGDALTAAILETPYADPRAEVFESHPEFTREQIVLAGACYYYAGAGSLLLRTRALARDWPDDYSLLAGTLRIRATNQVGEQVHLRIGLVDDYDPQRVEAGETHAWIQLHDGNTYHLIDFTARNWWLLAAVQKMTPARYPNFVHMYTPITKEPSFTNLPYSFQPVAALREHMRMRLYTDEGFDPAVRDIALRAARILDWDTSKLSQLPVRQNSGIDIPIMHVLTAARQ